MEKYSSKSMIFSLKKILNEIWAFNRFYILLSIISVFIEGITPSLLLIIMQNIINSIQINEKFGNIMKLLLIYILIDLFKELFLIFENYYNTKFEKDFELSISTKIFSKAERIKLSDYENSNTYDVINRAQNEGGSRIISFYTSLLSIFSSIVTLITYALIIISFKPWIIVIIIWVPILKFIIETKYSKKVYELIYDRTNDQRKTWYINYILTFGNFYREIKLFNLFEFFINKYKKYVEKFNFDDLYLLKSRSISSLFICFVDFFIDGSLFIYISLLGIRGSILLGNMLTYINVIISCKNSITSTLMSFSQMIRESLYIEQLFYFFSLSEENNKGKIRVSKIEKIEFINVSYKYKNAAGYALKNINLEISEDEKVAIIGINGSGKSTLVKLIMGFYDDYEGSILINSIDLKLIDKSSLRKRVSALFQDYIRYESTFKENILYGDINGCDSNLFLDLIKAFKFNKMLDSFQRGVNTQLGNWFDEGINLSNGEWQKIALARAFAKKADVFILDEPNSAMDVITETETSQACKKLLEDKIGIIITHKLNNSLNELDNIIILDKGKIKEEGKHNDLLLLRGVYYRLFTQNKETGVRK